jgi:hypothetical protein
MTTDHVVAGACGKMAAKYLPKAMAASAMGAANPTVTESQPERKPTQG